MFLRDKYSRRDSYFVNTTPYAVEECGIYHVDATGGNRIINLPDISGFDGVFVDVSKYDTSLNTINIVPYGTQTISNFTNVMLYKKADMCGVFSRGGNWYFSNTWEMAQNTQLRANDGNFAFYDSAKPYLEITVGSWSKFASFIFRGTDIWNPTRMYAILSGSRNSGNYYLRLWCSDTGLQVVSYNWTNGSEIMHTISPIINLPVGLSKFEYQAYATSGKVRIHAIGLYP